MGLPQSQAAHFPGLRFVGVWSLAEALAIPNITADWGPCKVTE